MNRGPIVVVCGVVDPAGLSDALHRFEIALVLATVSMQKFSGAIEDLEDYFMLNIKSIDRPVLDCEPIPVRRHYGPIIHKRKGKQRKW